MVLQSLPIGAVVVSNRRLTAVWAAAVVVSMVVVKLESLLSSALLLFVCHCPSVHLTSPTPWSEGCGAAFTQKGEVGPHLLNILQVDDIMGLIVLTLELAVLVMVAVVVIADLEDDNGPHRFVGLFALGKDKFAHVQPSYIELSISLHTVHDLF